MHTATATFPPEAERGSSHEVWLLFAAYCALYVAVGILVQYLVLTPAVLERTWTESGLASQADLLRDRADRWRWLGYAMTPVMLFMRTGFTTVCLAVGAALMDWQLRLVDLYRIALHSEIVWAAAAVVQTVGLLVWVDVATVADFTGYFPLSALSLVHLGEDEAWMTYLLKTINVFEVFYVAALVAAARRVARRPLREISLLVTVSYLSGTVLLVAAVTFIHMALT